MQPKLVRTCPFILIEMVAMIRLITFFSVSVVLGYNSIHSQTGVIGDFYTVEKDFSNSSIDGYNVYVPTNHSKPLPIIVFLQGGLGVGGEVGAIFNWELPHYMKTRDSIVAPVDDYIFNKFIFLMPHISEGQFYDVGNAGALQSILIELGENYAVDTSRIYLTGLSRGGHGTWGLASQIPAAFAAIAPIAGAPHGVENYQNLASLPIFVSHNLRDNRVDYRGSDEAVKNIEQVTGRRFHRVDKLHLARHLSNDQILISTDSESHDAWTELYLSRKFYEWLLRFSK